ncbi:MAG: TetR family transcriptional regulator [Acidimicrobiales bacterium]|nr:TetR family transcriptional regulator [Acidimicrobiales bacterium]
MSGTDGSARQRLIDAAIEAIVEDGYYRASSNQIARRAGLTWGVIQHHFGTRDRLLLEVVRQSADQLSAGLAAAQLTGTTVAERLGELADVVWQQYRRPEFLATAQIIMNLSRDPSTARDTLDELDKLSDPTSEHWRRLVDQVIEPARQPPQLASSLFRILRGVAVGDELLDSMAARGEERSSDDVERQLLVAALAAALNG